MTLMHFGRSKRLLRLLEEAPAPTPWGWKTYPPFTGPNSKTLVWKEDRHIVSLVEQGNEDSVYLALSFYCYVLKLDPDRFLVWYDTGPTISPEAFRVHLICSTSLAKIQRLPVYNSSVHNESSQICYDGKKVTADIPTKMVRGIHSFSFPDEMKSVNSIAVLVAGTDRPIRHASGTGFSGTSVYILQPAMDKIEVVPLDWWNDSKTDFSYMWIRRVILDSQSGTLVGDGKGALAFEMHRRLWNHSKWTKRNL